jgi:serine/threonine-protein kinase
VLQFFRRPIDEFEAAPMQGTEDGSSPFFSPDGQWVGFSDGDALLTIALAGGPAQTLTALPNHIRGADWGVDEMIVFGLSMPGGELMQIPSAGGEPKPLFTPDDERESWYPQVLAGGEAVLFTLSGPRPDAGELHLVMPETGEDRTLLPNAVAGRVLDSGHLVFVRSGALWAVPFDSDRLDIVGNPLPVVNDVGVGLFGAAKHALADDGTLVYVPSNTATVGRRELVWVERDGREEPIAVPVRDYVNVSLSPDGTRAAFGLANDSGNVDIWTSELARGSLSRLTTHEAGDGYPLWGPGGLRVAFASNRNGPFEVFWQIEDGSEDAERLVAIESESVIPFDWSPDGTTLFAVATLPGTGRDVGRGSVEEPGSWEPLIQSAANEWWPKISPNGQWLAYTSDETGRNEVYVLRFPALENRRPISVGGGHAPSWSADGRELFYLRAPTGGAPDALMRVAIDIDEAEPPSLIPGTPERLFDWQYYWDPGFQFYQIAPDGQRFLMITTGADSGGSEINIVLNWHQELLERVPIP